MEGHLPVGSAVVDGGLPIGPTFVDGGLPLGPPVVDIGLPLGPSVGGSFLPGLGDARQAPEGVQAVPEERGESYFWCVV